MSDYPMLISNKLHSFRNFVPQNIITFFFIDEAEQRSECGNPCRVVATGDAAYFSVLQKIDIEGEII